MTPSAQTSIFSLYVYLFTISGAMYSAVPQLILDPSLFWINEKPKSTSLTSREPDVSTSIIFYGLRSL